MSWLDQQLFGVRRIFAAGVQLAERGALNFVGFTVADNPATGRTDITAAGATDATTSAKGVVQLAGDLAGTAALPRVVAIAGATGTATIGAKRLSTPGAISAIDSYWDEVSTASAAPTTILTVPIPAGRFARLDVQVVCKDAAGARRTFDLSRLVENASGTVSVTTRGTDGATGTGAHAVSVVASSANVVVQVTGTTTACTWQAIADVKAVG